MADPIELLKRVAQENGLKADPNDYLKRNQGNYTEALRSMLADNDLALDDEEAAHKMFGLPVLSQTYIDENWKTDKEVEELSSRSNELFDKISKVKKGELKLSDIANIPETEIDEASKKRLFDNALTDYTKELAKINDTLAKNDELRSFGFNKVEKPPLGQRALSEVKRKIKELKSHDPYKLQSSFLPQNITPASKSLDDANAEAAKLEADLNKEGTEDPVVISYQTALKNGAAQAGSGKNGYVAGLGIMNEADAKLRRQLEMAAEEVEKDPENEEKKARLELIAEHYKEQQNQFAKGFGVEAAIKKEEEANQATAQQATQSMNWLEKAKISTKADIGRMWHTTIGAGIDNILAPFRDENLDQFLERRKEQGMAAAKYQKPQLFEGQPVQRYVEVGDKRFKVDQFGDIMYPVDKDMNPLNETLDKEAKEYDANRDKYGVKLSFSISRLVGASTQVAINMAPIIATNLGTSLIPGIGQVKGIQSIASIGASFLTMFNDNFERALQSGGSFDRAWNAAFITTLPQALIEQLGGFEARTGRMLGESVKRGLTKNLEDMVERYATKGTPQGFIGEWFGALKRELPGETFEELAQDFTGAYMDYARNGIALEIDPLDEINMGLSLPFTVGTFSGVTTYLSTRKDQKRWKESMIAATMASNKSREFMQNAVDGGAMTKEEMDARLGVITDNEAIVDDIRQNDRLSQDAKNKVFDMVAERALAKARANGAKNNTDRDKYQKQADAITDDAIRDFATKMEGKKSNEAESPFNVPVTEEEINKADGTTTTQDTGTPQEDTAGEEPQAAEPTETQAPPTDTGTEQPSAEGAATVLETKGNVEGNLREIAPAYDDAEVTRVMGIPIENIVKDISNRNPNATLRALPSAYENRVRAELKAKGIETTSNTKLSEINDLIKNEVTQERGPVAEAEATPQEVVPYTPRVSFYDVMGENQVVTKEGKEGVIKVDDGGKVTFESEGTIEEVGNIDDLQGESLSDYGFSAKDVAAVTNRTYKVGEDTYISDNLDGAVERDADGNLTVTLMPVKGGKAAEAVVFKGQQAENLAYQIRLDQFSNLQSNEGVRTFEAVVAESGSASEQNAPVAEDTGDGGNVKAPEGQTAVLGKSEYKKVGDVWSDAKGKKVSDKGKIAALERKLLPDAEVTLSGKNYTRFQGDWYTDKDKKVNTPLSISKLDKKADTVSEPVSDAVNEANEPAPKTEAPQEPIPAPQEAPKAERKPQAKPVAKASQKAPEVAQKDTAQEKAPKKGIETPPAPKTIPEKTQKEKEPSLSVPKRLAKRGKTIPRGGYVTYKGEVYRVHSIGKGYVRIYPALGPDTGDFSKAKNVSASDLVNVTNEFDEIRKAWKDLKASGIIFDPWKESKKQKALLDAIGRYVWGRILAGAQTFKEIWNDLKKILPGPASPAVKRAYDEQAKEAQLQAREPSKPLSLQEIKDYAAQVIAGTKVYKRFSQDEQSGITKGGRIHAEASLILGTNAETGSEAITSNEGQEKSIEEYAKKEGIWVKDVNSRYNKEYGDPIGSGQESIVWGDSNNGIVIKTQHTYMYGDLQEKLDGITLFNAYFPEASVRVIGFGRNAEGDFQVIIEQPFIEAHPTEKVTQEQINEFLGKHGFTNENENNFSNKQTLIEDLHIGNVILTPQGNLIVIDPIMRLNTPEQGYGGIREVGRIELQSTQREPMPIDRETYNSLLENLDESIKGILGGVLSGKEFASTLKEQSGREIRNAKGTVYGFVGKDGKVYLNGEKINANTPIHEYGHVWINAVRKARPDIYNKGLEIADKTKYVAELLKNPAYKDAAIAYRKGNKTALLEEALAMAIGDRGEMIVNSANKKRFKEWLKDFWNSVKEFFGGKLTDLTPEQVQNLKPLEFIELAAGQLVGGERVFEGGTSTDAKLQIKEQYIQIGDKNISLTKLKEYGEAVLSERLLLQRLSPQDERGRIEGGRRTVEATILVATVQGSSGKVEGSSGGGGPYVKRKEQAALEQYAKSEGIWVDNVDSKFGKPHEMGTENKVYLDSSGAFVTKINDGSYYKSWYDVFDRIAVHNRIAPYAKYEVVGFGKTEDGDFRVVLIQPNIRGVPADRGAINAHMSVLGYNIKPGGSLANPTYVNDQGVIVWDLHMGNVVANDAGEIRIIDPLIDVKEQYKFGEIDLSPLDETDGTNTTFDANTNDIRFQIIGEQGAQNIPRAKRGLDAARQLEQEGKSPENIWLATGWERGGDGLWRYEIPDISLNEDVEDGAYTAENILGARDIFKAYPVLKNQIIIFTRSKKDAYGSTQFTNGVPIITVHRAPKEDGQVNDRLLEQRWLAHELQHVIQVTEGFPIGSSPDYFWNARSARIIQQERGRVTEFIGERLRRGVEASVAWVDYIEVFHPNLINDIAFEYEATAGEVEARNVETRMGMQGRNKTPLSATEDVARESQIYLKPDGPLKEQRIEERQSSADARVERARLGLIEAWGRYISPGAVYTAKNQAENTRHLIARLLEYAIARGIKTKEGLVALVKKEIQKVAEDVPGYKAIEDYIVKAVLRGIRAYDKSDSDTLNLTEQLADLHKDIHTAPEHLYRLYDDAESPERKAQILKFINVMLTQRQEYEEHLSAPNTDGLADFEAKFREELDMYIDLDLSFGYRDQTNWATFGTKEATEAAAKPSTEESINYAFQMLSAWHAEYRKHGDNSTEFVRLVADWLSVQGEGRIGSGSIRAGLQFLVNHMRDNKHPNTPFSVFANMEKIITEKSRAAEWATRMGAAFRSLQRKYVDRHNTAYFGLAIEATDKFMDAMHTIPTTEHASDIDNHDKILQESAKMKGKGESRAEAKPKPSHKRQAKQTVATRSKQSMQERINRIKDALKNC